MNTHSARCEVRGRSSSVRGAVLVGGGESSVSRESPPRGRRPSADFPQGHQDDGDQGRGDHDVQHGRAESRQRVVVGRRSPRRCSTIRKSSPTANRRRVTEVRLSGPGSGDDVPRRVEDDPPARRRRQLRGYRPHAGVGIGGGVGHRAPVPPWRGPDRWDEANRDRARETLDVISGFTLALSDSERNSRPRSKIPVRDRLVQSRRSLVPRKGRCSRVSRATLSNSG